MTVRTVVFQRGAGGTKNVSIQCTKSIKLTGGATVAQPASMIEGSANGFPQISVPAAGQASVTYKSTQDEVAYIGWCVQIGDQIGTATATGQVDANIGLDGGLTGIHSDQAAKDNGIKFEVVDDQLRIMFPPE